MLHSISLANFTRELPSFAQIQLWKWVFLIKNLQKHKTENLHLEESLYVYALSPRCDGPMHSSGCRQLATMERTEQSRGEKSVSVAVDIVDMLTDQPEPPGSQQCLFVTTRDLTLGIGKHNAIINTLISELGFSAFLSSLAFERF